MTSSKCIIRCESNPILTSEDMPLKSALVFNPGVIKYNGQYVMIFRNDYGHISQARFEGTNMCLAFSDDGVNWKIEKEPFFSVDMLNDPEIVRFYDPRLTVIEDEIYLCFAVDSRHGVRGGMGKVSKDFKSLEVLYISVPDNRNFVLLPEKIDGKFVRLERPMPVYGRGGRDRFDIWISKSKDMKYWGEHQLLLGVENVPYANDKIGPAAPPIKTEKGWLTIFHAVDRDDTRGKNGWEDAWTKRYSAGLMLLDLEDPTKIIGMYNEPLIAPEVPYETSGGFRDWVIFPCGLIDEGDGTVKIYYGAADTFICLATAKIDELIKLCE